MLNGKTFRDAVISGANNICIQKQSLNDLNIFPVPDGDTGTNMSMTITSAKKVLESSDKTDIGEIAKETASAMLRGARGNSGVILSILFRGIAKGLEGKSEIDGRDLVSALGIGVEEAYKAVTKPTEGTILTVARMAYEKGLEALSEYTDEVSVWESVCNASFEALELTPKFLPVLRKAGVVDAGGKGLCVIFDGMMSVISGNGIIEYTENTGVLSTDDDSFSYAASQFDDVINFTYCTEFIVGKSDKGEKDISKLKEYLLSLGDCLVVVEDDEIIKVHVHTDAPGNALQKGLLYGELLTVKVENMREQHKNAGSTQNNKPEKEEIKEVLEFAEPTEETGFVAVAAGKGIKEIFMDMGCNHVVSGGQSMNPSTDDIYEAIMATPAKNVFVFPNNKNIIMASKQALDLVKDRNVFVLETKTIPQGITALISYDDMLSAEDNITSMSKAIENISTGQVTFAARDSEFGGKKIKEGEIIGLDNGRLTVCEKTPV
ncbi:MAG: DAK2 domain-containing protein, partial [Acutalibacteraceae bacterium]